MRGRGLGHLHVHAHHNDTIHVTLARRYIDLVQREPTPSLICDTYLIEQLAHDLVPRARQRRDQVGGVVEGAGRPQRGGEDGAEDEEPEEGRLVCVSNIWC